MGIVTQRARTFVNNPNNRTEAGDYVFGRVINTDYAYGVVIVRDWAGNCYHTEAFESNSDGTHAEFAILGWLGETYRSGIPFPAKIICYISQSPCRRCTEMLPDTLAGCYEELAANYPLYFSFVFHNWYVGAIGNRDPRMVWGSQQEASNAYRSAEARADQWTAGADNNSVTGIMRIRHIDETKGRSQARSTDFRYDPSSHPWGGAAPFRRNRASSWDGIRLGFGSSN